MDLSSFHTFGRLCQVSDGGRRETVAQSTWASRGWTFQEAVLSIRRFYFTERPFFFESFGILGSESTLASWVRPESSTHDSCGVGASKSRRDWAQYLVPATCASELGLTLRYKPRCHPIRAACALRPRALAPLWPSFTLCIPPLETEIILNEVSATKWCCEPVSTLHPRGCIVFRSLYLRVRTWPWIT
jgi:hypothetical protein